MKRTRLLDRENILEELHPFRVPLSKLNLDPANARIHDERNLQTIVSSLTQFGQRQPIVVQKQGMIVRAGNGRVMAARKMGWSSIAAIVVDESEVQATAYAIADNRTGELATWDDSALAGLLEAVKLDFDLPELGFDEAEFDALLPDEPVDGLTDSDEVPDVDSRQVSQKGDLWILGNHRLLCGDSTVIEQVGALMGESRYDLMITDPPYGVSYASKNEFLNAYDKGNRVQDDITGDHQTEEEMSAFWKAAFSTVRAYASKGASYYVTGPQGGDLLLLLLALRESDFPLRHMLIWAKNNHVLGRCDYNYKHEPIIFGWVKGTHQFYGTSQTSLWEIDRPTQSKLHPTMKPVALFERAMQNSSKKGDIIIDPFVGSGTTIIAAEQLKRRCYAIEIAPKYVDVTIRRWQEFTGKQAVHEESGKTFDEQERRR